MTTDMPERGRSQVHILEVVRTHARNACRFSASGTRRGGLATIYDFGLGAALCRW